MTGTTDDRLRMAILVVWTAGFLVGTTSHVLDLIAGGADTYGAFPSALRAFWFSLIILDPLTATFLLLRKRAGIILGVIVILSDIAVNWTVFFTIGGNPLFGAVNQTVFAVFLLTTAPVLWRWFASATKRGRRLPQS